MTTTTGISPSSTPMATTTSQTSATGNDALTFTQNYNTFLTMLTTQLQNQDPLNPMDTSQFTNQLVEFSQVEQQLKTNSQLETMVNNQAASEAISALPMVGQMIEYNGNEAVLENGQAGFSYTLPSDASSASSNWFVKRLACSAVRIRACSIPSDVTRAYAERYTMSRPQKITVNATAKTNRRASSRLMRRFCKFTLPATRKSRSRTRSPPKSRSGTYRGTARAAQRIVDLGVGEIDERAVPDLLLQVRHVRRRFDCLVVGQQ